VEIATLSLTYRKSFYPGSVPAAKKPMQVPFSNLHQPSSFLFPEHSFESLQVSSMPAAFSPIQITAFLFNDSRRSCWIIIAQVGLFPLLKKTKA